MVSYTVMISVVTFQHKCFDLTWRRHMEVPENMEREVCLGRKLALPLLICLISGPSDALSNSSSWDLSLLEDFVSTSLTSLVTKQPPTSYDASYHFSSWLVFLCAFLCLISCVCLPRAPIETHSRSRHWDVNGNKIKHLFL